MTFEWDENKNQINIKKHGISFEEGEGDNMRDEYDFSEAKKNPYAKELKKQITINLSPIVITYFKKEAENTGVPYQTLINLYLMDCVKSEKKINIKWQ